jgi:hypothetical protein
MKMVSIPAWADPGPSAQREPSKEQFMSEHYEKHAEKVVEGFMALLDDQVKSGISDEDRAELAMLVEAAISTAALQQLERAADEVAALSSRLRQSAEHYDKS